MHIDLHGAFVRGLRNSARLCARSSIITLVMFVSTLILPVATAAERAYVTDFGATPTHDEPERLLSVIDTSTNTVVATITLPAQPGGIALSPTGDLVYVALRGNNTVVILDTETHDTVATIPVAAVPNGITLHPSGNPLYVTNTASDTVSVIDTGSNTVVTTVGVGPTPVDVAINPAGTRVYTTNANGRSVSVIDTASNSVIATVSVGAEPGMVAVHPSGSLVYVANVNDDTISVIDTGSNTAIATIGVGARPSGVVVDPTGTRVYVSNGSSDTISVIDAGSNLVVATVGSGGSNPKGAAFSGSGRLYVTNAHSDSVSVLDPSTLAVVTSVGVGSGPARVAIGSRATPVEFAAFLRGSGGTANPPTLFLAGTASIATIPKYQDSPSVAFGGGNPWREVGTWASAFGGILEELSSLHVWLGLKNSDDQGTRFDLRAEVSKNSTLITASETLCITNLTRNPDKASEVLLSFMPFTAITFNSSTDMLSLRLLTRVGTVTSGAFCGGHSNAVGLRLYFDSVNRNARLEGSMKP